ncbi:MAG TPA: M1 family metallopeptidase [Gemmatimonadaceae bacterium]|nr:M1 family metallopeptidase [Gemmatimonadaceae bacterium]
MTHSPLIALLLTLPLQLAAQLPLPGAVTTHPAIPGAYTTPASGDTVGYWQQFVNYRMTATLDEAHHLVHGTADLTYVNHSPDTLRQMYFHQYLNAFRPGSNWSAVDEREGRTRFQHLQDPDYGYERFTAVPTVNGTPVFVDYPGAPDSTVAHIKLPRPLPPGDSVLVHLEWDARPSTVLRRQGRQGRSYDLAQWYPKVAVYDRAGWEQNPLVPSGELYGEYGTYDVTLVLPQDQVVGATGVPIEGDPGWARVKQWGVVHIPRDAYDSVPEAPDVTVPDGDRVVRFYARNVHHFAWSVSPDYRYEGAIYVRQVPPTHFKTWDTLSINVLYRPGDDSTWGHGRAIGYTIDAFKWLEEIWGPYAWPAFTNLHRLEGGGTEFPMMIMDGSASRGLILHEGGHNFSYGILGNNEWRSGWMDEGLTSYQTAWAQDQTPQARAAAGPPPPPLLAPGYRALGTTMTPAQRRDLNLVRLDMEGHSQPIGTPAFEFRDFGTYNAMIYSRGELMYSQLRDVLGDSVFRAFFHDYYNRWALKHVDEWAMQASAQRVSGRNLRWFFDEWVDGVGLVDYSLDHATITPLADGRWQTTAWITRRGDYRHPMPVGVRTDTGWVLARGEALPDHQQVELTTASRPLEVRLDPLHTTYDWDRRNDVPGPRAFGLTGARPVFDWPFLDQSNRDYALVKLSPLAWYSDPGALTVGMRARTSYLDLVDKYDLGLAVTSGLRATPGYATPKGISRLQGWVRVADPYWPSLYPRPMLRRSGGIAALDGVLEVDATHGWDLSPFWTARGPTVSLSLGATGAFPYDRGMLPAYWENRGLAELHGAFDVSIPHDPLGGVGTMGLRATAAMGATTSKGYARVELTGTSVSELIDGVSTLSLRVYTAASSDPPAQRALHLSVSDPLATFQDNWYRPRGSILTQRGVNFVPLGGAGLRGYDPAVTMNRIVAGNAELAQRLVPDVFSRLSLWASVFGEAGFASSDTFVLDGALLADAGAGISLRGRLYDRPVTLRLDAPLLVQQPALAGGRGLTTSNATLAARWTFSIGDLW